MGNTAVSELLLVALFPVLMIAAGASDVLALRISNRLVIGIAAAAFPAAWIAGMPLPLFGMHMAVAAGLLAAGYGLFSFGLVGGGDAKLLAAAGLWFGGAGLMQFFIMTAMAGGALALALMAWSNFRIHAEILKAPVLGRFGIITPPIPYGFALAIGAVAAYPESWWINQLLQY